MEISKLLPPFLSVSSKHLVSEAAIMKIYSQLRGYSSHDCRLSVIEYMREWSDYGISHFLCTVRFLFLNISLSIATHAYSSKWQTLWSESTRYSSRIVFRSIPFQCIYTILPLFGHFCLGTLWKHHFFLPSHKAKPNPLFLLFTICFGCIRHYQSLYIMSFCLFEVNSIKKVVVIKSHLGENAIIMDLH